MFWNKKNRIDKKMIPNIIPTSKAALKTMCLLSANGDIEKATKLYEYMVKDMEDMPIYDIPKPSVIDQVKSGFSETWDWLNQNQEQVVQVVNVVKSFMSKGGGGGGIPPTAPPTAPIPPIN